MSEKYVISLIVKGNDLSSLELGLMREQASKHTANSGAQLCTEVIEDDLRLVRSWSAVTLSRK